jgi:hypothetical protein
METISRGDVIKLDDGFEYAVVKGKKVEGNDYCILATVKKPINFSLDQIRHDEKGRLQVCECNGNGCTHILKEVLDIADKQ